MSDTFEVLLDRIDGYRFRTDFGSPEIPELIVDEPPPLGRGSGPNPTRLLATAVGNCLSASLIFCLSKSRVELGSVKTKIEGNYVRNERNRLRIGGLVVTIEIDLAGNEPSKLEKCLGLFEDFCVVTATVRQGLDVKVVIVDTAGKQLHASAASGA